jgi:hypothetical protein
MKKTFMVAMALASLTAFAQTVPVITLPPSNLTVSPGNTATFNVTATGATSYQWLFNGTNIAGATSATLQVANAQSTNSGYYNVIAKNATGWVPSQMAWLAVVGSSGIVPFSNVANTNTWGQAISQVTYQPINGSAQVMAGPALDQMQLIVGNANKAKVTNGWFNPTIFDGFSTTNKIVSVPNVAAGQTVYYAVYIAYTNDSITYTQQSTVISLTAGGNSFPVPSLAALRFPYWIEWPDPICVLFYSTARNLLGVPGETVTLTNFYWAYTDFGIPYGQWRKNGNLIPGATNYVQLGFSGSASLVITNIQPNDAGIYDFVLYGNNWMIAPIITLSIQTTNGQGVFQKPKFAGTNFICDLVGATGRNYQVQWSTNLTGWNNLTTLTNLTGTVTFTNPSASTGSQFYRTVLLPF